MTGSDSRDHVFISYANEDREFVRWLALRLTREGYKVWCDEFKLLGGESYPLDVDDAIKNRSYRFLAVMSHSSKTKPNPLKERTVALNLAKERGEDFVIPLNLDRFSSADLNWMVSDITFIPFYESWADGLRRLNKKLNSVGCPRPLENGNAIVAGLCRESDVLAETNETVFTNLIEVTKVPSKMMRYTAGTDITYAAAESLALRWPCYRIDNRTLLSFFTPDSGTAETYLLHETDESDWVSQGVVFDVPSSNVAKNLIEKSIQAVCVEKGIARAEYRNDLLYFPEGAVEGNRLVFRDARGKSSWVLTTGTRKSRRLGIETLFRYNLGVRFQAKYYDEFGFCVQAFVGLHIEGVDGEQYSARARFVKARGIMKNWYNRELFNRLLAVVSYLSSDSDAISYGSEEEKIVFSREFRRCECNRGLGTHEDVTEEDDEKDDDSMDVIDEDEEDIGPGEEEEHD